MTFQDLPDMGNNLRLVGTSIMDETQFVTEGWREYRGYWMPTLTGLRAYAELRRKRTEDRRSSWQARVDAETEYGESINALLEERGL